jgi:hypothetical protein
MSTMTTDGRELLLEQAAFDTAQAWAQACCTQLTREGRRVEGGWPGTMPEARSRVGAQAARILTARSMTALTHEELGRLARLTYDEARRSWGTSQRRAASHT